MAVFPLSRKRIKRKGEHGIDKAIGYHTLGLKKESPSTTKRVMNT